MKADSSVNPLLNEVLAIQLIAINQYFLHARMLKNWGVVGLGKQIYHESIQQMKYADDTIERILLLEGLPNLQKLGKLYIGQSVAEIIECDLKTEYALSDCLKEAIESLEEARDYVSRELLEKFKEHNESWIDQLETQQDLIKLIGEQNYIQSVTDAE